MQVNKKVKKPVCFISNEESYPLCKGKKNGLESVSASCKTCNLYEDMKEGEY